MTMQNKPNITGMGESVELSEVMVLTRTRAPDLDSVKKLNCWASNIGDVKVVRRMPNLEVCSLSINKITSLRDFAHCYNLKELYVRTNQIERLEDIHYLKRLGRLRSLWLSENPCATTPNYRKTVLRTLPNLKKLDNIAVTDEEVQQAEVEGDSLQIPDDFSYSSIFDAEVLVQSGKSTRPDSAISAASFDGKWALPRKKRQQRKREQMSRSSNYLSGDVGASSGDGSDVVAKPNENGSSDSYTDGCNEESHDEDGVSNDGVEVRNSGVEVSDGGVGASNGGKTSDENTMKESIGEGESNAAQVVESSNHPDADDILDGLGKLKNNIGSSKVANAESTANVLYNTDVNSTSNNFDCDSTSERRDSVNILHISDVVGSSDIDHSVSYTSTLTVTHLDSSVQSNEIHNNSNNNSNKEPSDYDKHSVNIIQSSEHSSSNLELVERDSDPICIASTGLPAMNPSKGERSLLDQIRLDDSLNVVESAADDYPCHGEASASIELDDLNIQIGNDIAIMPAAQDQQANNNSASQPPTTECDKTNVSSKSVVTKPLIPNKPKPAMINWEEHNRLRTELGVKPLERTNASSIPSLSISSTSSSRVKPNAETSQNKNSNVLQAILCLVNELDTMELDVVADAVKTRMDKLKGLQVL